MSLPLPTRNRRFVCYVTDRSELSGQAGGHCERLVRKITEVALAGADLVQIREKDLDGRQLAELARSAIANVRTDCRILVNDRLDVARAAGAAGVHLGERSIPVRDARRFVGDNGPERFLIGASCHSLAAARIAQTEGADYVIFGPVFATPSKAGFGPPQGLRRLEEICQGISIPVVAIGGITAQTANECFALGAAGIAGIRLFQEAENLGRLMKELVGSD